MIPPHIEPATNEELDNELFAIGIRLAYVDGARVYLNARRRKPGDPPLTDEQRAMTLMIVRADVRADVLENIVWAPLDESWCAPSEPPKAFERFKRECLDALFPDVRIVYDQTGEEWVNGISLRGEEHPTTAWRLFQSYTQFEAKRSERIHNDNRR